MKGTEQLLFSFIVPSTFCSTDNIVELQKLVTQGENFRSLVLKWFFISFVSRLQQTPKKALVRGQPSQAAVQDRGHPGDLDQPGEQPQGAAVQDEDNQVGLRRCSTGVLDVQRLAEIHCRPLQVSLKTEVMEAYDFFFSEVKAACPCLQWSFKRAVIFFRFLIFPLLPVCVVEKNLHQNIFFVVGRQSGDHLQHDCSALLCLPGGPVPFSSSLRWCLHFITTILFICSFQTWFINRCLGGCGTSWRSSSSAWGNRVNGEIGIQTKEKRQFFFS